MKEGIIRKIDKLGRVVLPQQYKNALGWKNENFVFIAHKNDCLVLMTFEKTCFACGNQNHLTQINDKYICYA